MGSMRRSERGRVKRIGRKKKTKRKWKKGEGKGTREMEFMTDTDIKKRQTDHGEQISWKK